MVFLVVVRSVDENDTISLVRFHDEDIFVVLYVVNYIDFILTT